MARFKEQTAGGFLYEIENPHLCEQGFLELETYTYDPDEVTGAEGDWAASTEQGGVQGIPIYLLLVLPSMFRLGNPESKHYADITVTMDNKDYLFRFHLATERLTHSHKQGKTDPQVEALARAIFAEAWNAKGKEINGEVPPAP